MSIIGSVGGSGLDLTQMLQRLTGESESSQGQAVRGSPPEGAPPPGGPPDGGGGMISDKVGEFAKSAGLDSETVAALQEELDTAINEALEEADESTDVREVIDGAIQATLDEYGLDGEAFLSEMKASMPPEPPSPPSTGGEMTTSDIMSEMLGVLSNGTYSSSSTANLSLLDALA